MPASSVASRASPSRSSGRSAKPHILGGSNNLRSERQRREKAEAALQQTHKKLASIKEELAPRVLQLSDAVKSLEIEKRHHLDLEEASQDVLEALQAQLNTLEAWQQRFPVLLEEQLDRVMQQVREQATAEAYRFKLLLDDLRSTQDEHATELRLVHHESTRLQELDDKLFALDKEVLKLKLALPASAAARLSTGALPLPVATEPQTNLGGVAVQEKLAELTGELEAIKADSASCRSADRQQLEAITNRLREASRKSDRVEKDVETRLTAMETSVKQVVTKVPSELSKRLLQAQQAWGAELQTLKARVQQFEAELQRTLEGHKHESRRVGVLEAEVTGQLDAPVDMERVSHVLDSVDDLRRELLIAESAQEAARITGLARIAQVETDMVGLYDWTRAKVSNLEQELAYTSELVGFFSRHANLQPK